MCEELAKRILEEVCETDEIFEDYDMDLVEEGYLDSFGILNIILKIEEEMGIQLSPTDVNKEDINTVKKFTEFLTQISNK